MMSSISSRCLRSTQLRRDPGAVTEGLPLMHIAVAYVIAMDLSRLPVGLTAHGTAALWAFELPAERIGFRGPLAF